MYPVISSASPAGDSEAAPTDPGPDALDKVTEIAEEQWIELEFVDPDGEPVGDARYEIQPSSGGPAKTGRLNADGFVRVEGLRPGTCMVCFPDYNADAWQPA